MLQIFMWICYTLLIINDDFLVAQVVPTPGTNVSDFYNIILQDSGDPWVYKHTDRWYYTSRSLNTGIGLWRARTFTSLDAGSSKVVWTVSNATAACADVWAPELHYLQSKWYIYFSATTCDKNGHNYRMYVLENTNPDPFNGTFVFKGQMKDSTDKWAIDATVFLHPRGQLYCLWSGWEIDIDNKQIIYIAKMSNPWTITGSRVEIARSNYSWESLNQARINEAPQIIIYNGVISLVYSASGSWTNNYCLGLITTSNTSDPMNATSWTKRSTPIFQSANGILAPGHNCFTKSFDGKEDWLIYHSARFSGSGWTRQVRAQKFTWNADSTPNLGSPVNPNIPIKIPSGDPVRMRYEAENAILSNGPIAVVDGSSSMGMKVGMMDYSTSSVVFNINIATAGIYVVSMRNDNGSSMNATASHWVSVNNGTYYEFPIAYSGWDNWGASMFRPYFKKGNNTVTIKKGNNYAEIDAIDVYVNPT